MWAVLRYEQSYEPEVEQVLLFPSESAANEWMGKQRWPDDFQVIECSSVESVPTAVPSAVRRWIDPRTGQEVSAAVSQEFAREETRDSIGLPEDGTIAEYWMPGTVNDVARARSGLVAESMKDRPVAEPVTCSCNPLAGEPLESLGLPLASVTSWPTPPRCGLIGRHSPGVRCDICGLQGV